MRSDVSAVLTVLCALSSCAVAPVPRAELVGSHVQAAGPIDAQAEEIDDGIAMSSFHSARLDAARINAGVREIENGTYGNIHSLLIFRRGKLVSESYFPGQDENNHQGNIGLVRHNRDMLHDVRSISKSVVALAVLIAHERGRIKSLDQPVLDYFPELAREYAGGQKSQITIKHALTMTAGLETLGDGRFLPTETVALLFSRNLVASPGAEFAYNGGLTQLLAEIVQRSAGRDIEEFTREQLLAPLGIVTSEWAKSQDGEPDADSGLRLRSRDLAKIGLLIANRGRWRGTQILSSELVQEAVSEHIDIPQEAEAEAVGDRQGYGYQIWRFSSLVNDDEVDLLELSGNGGQKVYLDEPNQLMVVVTAGDYDGHDLKKSPLDIYFDIVRPAVLDR